MDKEAAKKEVEEEKITPGEVIKIDELDIGEFIPVAEEEADKNKKKLIEVEEHIKEVKELSKKVEEQKRKFTDLEKQVLELLENEDKLGNVVVGD